ncbi:LysR family transcriptional regulator [Paraburkholderia sp. Tr-20389]|uniref:LysR family transcriptional regulator n=1 Tax=Paraburkholderia sp. Tr-20389 TaxID=2703903 RepID=UPI00197F827C|nr:LysR family transcriptional regulator [Paraburkholderia sp. Tr-20389]MBN3754359.1 LysR family transcriptional regulator [Paraburkholderia sp. Tr-20389]
MRLSLYSLQVFLSVIDEGAISKAAEKEHIATSALSKRISELEQALGTPLLLRQARGVQPTVAGSVLAKGARLLLRNANDLAEEIEHFASGLSGHVRIAANLSSITQFLPPELARFSEANPYVQVDLEERVSNEVVRLVAGNAADIGVYTTADQDVDLETFPYRKDRMVLVVPIEHTLADLDEVAFADTLEYAHVGMHPGSAANFMLMRHASDVQRQIKLRFQVTSYDAMIAMIRAGLGIGLMPNQSIASYKADGLKVLDLTDEWASRQLKLCVRSVDALTPAARMLLDQLRASVVQ